MTEAKCIHPDPKKLPWVLCRACGHWVEGVRIGDFSEEALKSYLANDSRDILGVKTTAAAHGAVIESKVFKKGER